MSTEQAPASGQEESHFLITGITGFLGKMVTWTILTTYPRAQISVLIRPKKGASAEQRLRELFGNVIFKGVQNVTNVRVVEGDITQPLWGVQSDKLSNITCIISSAANVQFNNEFKEAVTNNTISTYEGLKLARLLKARFVYVSTAYVNSYRKSGSFVPEELPRLPHLAYAALAHDPPRWDMLWEKPEVPNERRFPPPNLAAIFGMDVHPRSCEEMFRQMGFPNTYTMSKAVAEHLVMKAGVDAAIVRPSIITPALGGPAPFLLDSNAGPTPVVIGWCMGVLRSTYCAPTKFDLVPVDYVANLVVLAAITKKKPTTPIYHLTCGPNVVTSQAFMKMCVAYLNKAVLPITNLKVQRRFARAHVKAVTAINPKLGGVLDEGYKRLGDLEHFCGNEFNFDMTHTKQLVASTPSPLKFTDLNNLCWKSYTRCYTDAVKAKCIIIRLRAKL